jgi:hypothetical protein
MLGTILIMILVLALIGALPRCRTAATDLGGLLPLCPDHRAGPMLDRKHRWNNAGW